MNGTTQRSMKRHPGDHRTHLEIICEVERSMMDISEQVATDMATGLPGGAWWPALQWCSVRVNEIRHCIAVLEDEVGA